MLLSSETMARIISRRFLRSGGEGQWVRLFQNIATDQQTFLLNRLGLLGGEIPVIGGVGGDGRWILLTTSRVVWGSGEQVTQLSLDQIRLQENPFTLAENAGAGHRMDKMQYLAVLDDDMIRHSLSLESGRPWIGVVNVLLWLVRRNRSGRAVVTTANADDCAVGAVD